MNYKESWEEQMEFMRAKIHWMDATVKASTSDKERLDAESKKQVLEIMVKRMESKEFQSN